MRTALQHSMWVATLQCSRRLRRLVPVSMITPGLAMMVASTAVLVSVIGGAWAGAVTAALGVATDTVMAICLIVMVVVGWSAGSIWPHVRASLVEQRSWMLIAHHGVSPVSYLCGRHVLARSLRMICALGCVAAFLVVLSRIASEPIDPLFGVALGLVAPAALMAGTLFVVLRLTAVTVRPRRIVAGAVVLIAFVAAAGWSVFHAAVHLLERWGGSVSGDLETSAVSHVWAPALIAASAAVIGAAVTGLIAARRFDWADIVERTEAGGVVTGERAAVRPTRVASALVLLEARRMTRSFEWRIRPPLFTTLALTLSVVILSVAGGQLVPEVIAELSAGPVGATVIAGICAGYALVVHSSLAPFVSLDSDRRGLDMLRLVPFGLARIGALRAAIGATSVAITAGVFLVIMAVASPLQPATIGTAAAASASVAVVAPVLSAACSFRYPQPEWKEAAELGQRGWARTLSTYGVGVAIAITITLASAQSWTALSAAIAVGALVLVPPVAAAGAAAALSTTSRGVA